MNLIAAVDKNWAIGCKNKLLVSIPADMKFFRETTTGKVVVMGRKTLDVYKRQPPRPCPDDHAGNGRTWEMASQEPQGL